MQRTGFQLVDGDASRGVEPATARHWATCAAFVIVAQWLLGKAGEITNFALSLLGSFGFGAVGGNYVVAFPSVAWLIFPFAVLALLVSQLSKKFDKRDWTALGLSPRALTGGLPWVLAGLFASFPTIATFFLLPPGWMEASAEALVWLVPATLIQSGAEELLFRGALLAMLVARYGARSGVLISAALFALWHVTYGQGLVDFGVAVITTFIFGVTSAILVLHQGHLGGAIALHLVWNLVGSVDAGTEQLGDAAFMRSDDFFWQSYLASYFSPWTLTDLQDTASRNGLIFPLLLESLIILGACRETAHQIFAAPRPSDEIEPTD